MNIENFTIGGCGLREGLMVNQALPITQEKPISDAYAVIDNDLARDNVENDLTAADLQDL